MFFGCFGVFLMRILDVKKEGDRKNQLFLPTKPFLIPDISFSIFLPTRNSTQTLEDISAPICLKQLCSFFFVLIPLTAAFQQLRKNLGLLDVNYYAARLLPPPNVHPDPALLHHKNTTNYATRVALQ